MHEEKKVSYTHEFYCIIIYNIVVERKKYFYVMYKEKKVVFEQPLLSGLPLCKQLMSITFDIQGRESFPELFFLLWIARS
jgi:hypothetical protein